MKKTQFLISSLTLLGGGLFITSYGLKNMLDITLPMYLRENFGVVSLFGGLVLLFSVVVLSTKQHFVD
jgi:hypothetical protein